MTAFFDTNVLIYATVQADHRQATARRLMSRGGSISVQVLNEFANTAHRKLRKSWDDIHFALQALRSAVAAPRPIMVTTHELALALTERHKFPFYDALIVASALEAKCTTLYTEDMHHGMIVGESLRIINPFRTDDHRPVLASSTS